MFWSSVGLDARKGEIVCPLRLLTLQDINSLYGLSNISLNFNWENLMSVNDFLIVDASQQCNNVAKKKLIFAIYRFTTSSLKLSKLLFISQLVNIVRLTFKPVFLYTISYNWRTNDVNGDLKMAHFDLPRRP